MNNIKKIIIGFIIALMCVNVSVFAYEIEEETDYVWLKEEIENVSTNVSKEPSILLRSAIAFDRNSKTILYGKNYDKEVPMASTTKIMTAIVMLENVPNLQEKVEVCKQAAGVGGSRLGLKTGDIITYNDLLYGLMLCSGNDAATQIAISVGGSISQFANLMNEKAKEMGLSNSHFITPHGLDNEGHYTTALELAKMADYALNIEKFAKVVNTKSYTVNINGYPKNINNTNELLRIFRRSKWRKNRFYKWSGKMFSNIGYKK